MSRDDHVPATRPGDIRVLNPFEVPDWDRQIAAWPEAGFFHTTAWARVLHDTYGYAPIYLARIEQDRLRAALPLMEVNSWLTGRRGVSLPFTDALRPLADADDFRALFAAAQARGRERGWKYLECRGGRAALPDAPASTSFLNHVLALDVGEPALFAGCSDAVQRALRKAERAGLTLEFAQSPTAMRDFYELLRQTRQRHGVPPQPWRFFAAIQRHVLASNHGWVALARQGRTPVAGAVYFHFNREVIYKFGASNLAFQQLRANNLVMWQAIRRYAAEGFSTLDFGRTSLANEGLRRFKLGWGTREQTVEYVRHDFKTGQFATARDESSGWHTRVFQATPMWLSRPLGAWLYPHMG